MNTILKHVPYWIVIVVAGLIALHFHDKHVADQALIKQQTDSMATAKALLDSIATAALAQAKKDSLDLAAREAEIKTKDKVVTIFHDSYHKLADSLTRTDSTYKNAINTIVNQADSALAVRTAQRDSALLLFHTEQIETNKLKGLLLDYQNQNTKIFAQLKQAQKKSILESTPVQVVTKVLAVKGVVDLIQGK